MWSLLYRGEGEVPEKILKEAWRVVLFNTKLRSASLPPSSHGIGFYRRQNLSTNLIHCSFKSVHVLFFCRHMRLDSTKTPAQTRVNRCLHAFPLRLCCWSSSTCGHYRSHLSLALCFIRLLPHWRADRFYSSVFPRGKPSHAYAFPPSHLSFIHTYFCTDVIPAHWKQKEGPKWTERRRVRDHNL